jgi:hypothetical protein
VIRSLWGSTHNVDPHLQLLSALDYKLLFEKIDIHHLKEIMFGALYDWAFSSDATVVSHKFNGVSIPLVLQPNDKISVFSERHQTWFEDGIVVSTYRDGIYVTYGVDKYFGFALTKGNSKYIACADIPQKIRLKSVRKLVLDPDPLSRLVT